jgi:hypothetical protein
MYTKMYNIINNGHVKGNEKKAINFLLNTCMCSTYNNVCVNSKSFNRGCVRSRDSSHVEWQEQ